VRKTPPCKLDECQPYTNSIFQPFDEEEDDYGSSDSSPATPSESLFSNIEVKCVHIIIMPVMVIATINLEEELANIEATPERPSKESEEKNAQIKCQNEQIADLRKESRRLSSKVSNKGSGGDDFDKESNHSNDKCK